MRDDKVSGDDNTHLEDSVPQERTTSSNFYENGGKIGKKDIKKGDIRINNAQNSYVYYGQSQKVFTYIFYLLITVCISEFAL